MIGNRFRVRRDTKPNGSVQSRHLSARHDCGVAIGSSTSAGVVGRNSGVADRMKITNRRTLRQTNQNGLYMRQATTILLLVLAGALVLATLRTLRSLFTRTKWGIASRAISPVRV